MKRFISVLLCCVMMMSVFSTAFTVSAANVKDYLSVSTEGMSDGKITYKINILPTQTKFTGSIIHIVYDSTALAVESAGAAGGSNPVVLGQYENGAHYSDANKYALAYINLKGVDIAEKKDFMTITFNVIAQDGGITSVDFRCIEYKTDDGNAENDIKKSDEGVSFYSNEFLTLDTPKVSNVYSSGKNLVVEWAAVPGAETYNVFRRVSGTSAWSKIKSGVTATTYTDTTITTGVEYEYTVSAANSNGETAYNTNGVYGFNFGSVETLSAKPTVNGIIVTWGALQSAESYELYRKKASESTWTKVTTTTGTSYTDNSVTSGVDYNYKVEAIKGTYRAETNASVIPTVKFLKTAVPTITKVYAGTNALVVEWGEVANGKTYNVYRKTAGSSWAKIKSGVTGTSYTDTAITKGTEYFYAVSAVNALNCETAYNTTGVAGLNFGTVTNVKAAALANGAKVTWDKLQYATSYEVFRKEASQSDSAWVSVATVTTNSYVDTSIESFVEYNYKVEAINGVYRAGTTGTIPTVKFLAAPEFAAISVEDGIQLSYSAVYGATGYVIERKVGTGAYVKLAEVNAVEGVYVDKNVVAGSKYTYRIRALSTDINSEWLESVAITRLATPEKMVSISVDVSGMTVTWTPVAGATEYKIYRKEIDGDAYTVIGTATGTSYTDTTAQSNVVYTYTVSAANANGCGAYTENSITRLFIASPKLLSRENVVNGVKITWSAIDGATCYRIYRRGAGVNYWHYLGTIDAKNTSYVDYGKDVNGKNIGMKNGEYYRYTVRASNETRPSNFVYPGGYNVTIYSGFDPTGLYLKCVATPKLASVTNVSAGVYIKWNAVAGATSYRIYRRGAGATYWYYLGETSGTAFTDTAIASASGKYYRYTVRAVSGYYSGFDTNGLYLQRLSDPVLISARSSTAGITVKWAKVAGTTGYYVYRKTSNTTWQLIGTAGGTNTTQFVDKTAQKGVTYTYTVRACCGKNLSSYNAKGLTCKDLY